jgi:hypothetical protein
VIIFLNIILKLYGYEPRTRGEEEKENNTDTTTTGAE